MTAYSITYVLFNWKVLEEISLFWFQTLAVDVMKAFIRTNSKVNLIAKCIAACFCFFVLRVIDLFYYNAVKTVYLSRMCAGFPCPLIFFKKNDVYLPWQNSSLSCINNAKHKENYLYTLICLLISFLSAFCFPSYNVAWNHARPYCWLVEADNILHDPS